MSAQRAAARERERPDLPDHLTRDGADPGVTSQQFLERENEAYCTECGSRVTIGKSGREYGHKRHPDRCPERSRDVDPWDNRNTRTPSERAALEWLSE